MIIERILNFIEITVNLLLGFLALLIVIIGLPMLFFDNPATQEVESVTLEMDRATFINLASCAEVLRAESLHHTQASTCADVIKKVTE